MVESIDKLRNFSVCQKSLGEGNAERLILPVQPLDPTQNTYELSRFFNIFTVFFYILKDLLNSIARSRVVLKVMAYRYEGLMRCR